MAQPSRVHRPGDRGFSKALTSPHLPELLPQSPAAEGFFREAESAFERSVDATGRRDVFTMRLGGEDIRVEFAGSALTASCSRAFSHLACDPGDVASPALTIRVWDSETTGVQMPRPRWGPYDYGPRGEIRGFNDDRFGTVFQIDPGCLSMIDRQTGTGLFWIRRASDYPEWMRAAPLRTLLAWWGSIGPRQFVHGAGVGLAEQGVLLAGRGGSGKSTTALLCLRDGFDFVGDDYVLADLGTKPTMHSVYGSAKLDDRALASYLPELKPHVSSRIVGDGPDKGVVHVDYAPDRLVPSLPLGAVIVVRLGDQSEARYRSTTRADALTALAPTTLFQLAGASRSAFDVMGELVRRVPTFELTLGRDGGSGPRALRRLVEEL